MVTPRLDTYISNISFGLVGSFAMSDYQAYTTLGLPKETGVSGDDYHHELPAYHLSNKSEDGFAQLLPPPNYQRTDYANIGLLAGLAYPLGQIQTGAGYKMPHATGLILQNESEQLMLQRNIRTLFAHALGVKGSIETVPERLEIINSERIYTNVETQIAGLGIAPNHSTIYEGIPIKCGGLNCFALKGFAEIFLPDERLAHLMQGTTNSLPTGKEDALRSEILSRTDRSVTPEEMFVTSYRLNNGHTENTLWTIVNVLTEARNNPDREKATPVASKLTYIAHLEEGEGDNLGPWYHFFGAAVEGHARNGTGTAKFLVAMDEIFSISREPIDPHETYAGMQGAEFGAMLRNLPSTFNLASVL